jgi:tetratricopeptide (TPR) repeat protein
MAELRDREALEAQLSEADLVLEREADSPEPERDRIALALADKADALSRLRRRDESVAVWDELWERFSSDPPPDNHLLPLYALSRKSQDLVDLEHYEDAGAVCDELIERFRDSDELYVREAVASTMARRCKVLRWTGRCDQVPSAADELDRLIGSDPELKLTSELCSALTNRPSA